MRFANTRINNTAISDMAEFQNAQMPPVSGGSAKRKSAANRNRDSLMMAAQGGNKGTELRVSDKLHKDM